jgi:hypothetical protein
MNEFAEVKPKRSPSESLAGKVTMLALAMLVFSIAKERAYSMLYLLRSERLDRIIRLPYKCRISCSHIRVRGWCRCYASSAFCVSMNLKTFSELLKQIKQLCVLFAQLGYFGVLFC